jgi:hypothetical protein
MPFKHHTTTPFPPIARLSIEVASPCQMYFRQSQRLFEILNHWFGLFSGPKNTIFVPIRMAMIMVVVTANLPPPPRPPSLCSSAHAVQPMLFSVKIDGAIKGSSGAKG